MTSSRDRAASTPPTRPRESLRSAQGFNKNVTAYVTKGREALAKVPGGDFTLVHHNAYKANELGECFERNAEGMLKNMAIHELALLVTFFGVNSDTLSDVVADKAYSDLRTEKGPSSGSDFTDFSRIGFTVTTKAGAKVSVYADRCGLELPDGAMADGGMMCDAASVLRVDGVLSAARRRRGATVEPTSARRYSSVSKLGIIQSRDIMPDADLVATVEARSKENPDWMPYFHLQHDDYITLKERCCAHIANGAPGAPDGIADIQVACDTLKLAETLKPLLEKQLL